MEAKDINRFPIKQYLAGLNIYPAKDRNYYGMYHSPFREDNNASMKIDYNKNLWIDYGAGEGGTLIDLVMQMENCSSGEAMRLLTQRIENKSFPFQGEMNCNNDKPEMSNILITEIKELQTPALLTYLNERGLNIETAKLHCKEVHYLAKDKPYFAIGYKNDTGGYELRNKYFKGCTSKDISSIIMGNDTCQLFEGFIDYISLLTMKKIQYPTVDTIVLNSLTNLPKITNTLAEYKSIALFLDNDEAGKRAVQDLRSRCKNVIDHSTHYSNYKDLNEYLCSRFNQKQDIKRKPNKGFKL